MSGGMKLELDPESVQSIASAAIFDHMTQEARENVLKQAVEALLTPTPSRGGYGIGKTPLQLAFERAITTAAHQAIQEKIANDPEVSAKIHELLGPLLNAALEAEAENYDTSLADHLGQALGSWLAEQARKER